MTIRIPGIVLFFLKIILSSFPLNWGNAGYTILTAIP
jgi:hypothetical protein